MTHQNPTRLAPWPLDYSWAQRQGPWSTHSDVLLEGRGTDPTAMSKALEALGSGLEPQDHPMVQDTQQGYWCGGVFAYLGFDAAKEDSVSIWLHSRGEDAFDSLHATSKLFCQHLEAAAFQGALDWIEHPHQRDYRQRIAYPPGA